MNLKMYLASINMKVKDFCEIMDVGCSHMSNIITGRSKPSIRLAKQIEMATGGVVKLTPSRPKSKTGKTEEVDNQQDQAQAKN